MRRTRADDPQVGADSVPAGESTPHGGRELLQAPAAQLSWVTARSASRPSDRTCPRTSRMQIATLLQQRQREGTRTPEKRERPGQRPGSCFSGPTCRLLAHPTGARPAASCDRTRAGTLQSRPGRSKVRHRACVMGSVISHGRDRARDTGPRSPPRKTSSGRTQRFEANTRMQSWRRLSHRPSCRPGCTDVT